jgi:NTP pyrophosphatase (non-canonical NTP hydrolase)
MNFKRLNELVKEVGEWSAANFGDNGMGEFKHFRPLAGIVEEYGEWLDSETLEDELDAIADMGIYLLDFCYQTGTELTDMEMSDEYQDEYPGSVDVGTCLGKLNRICLKRVQKIRGYDNPEFYRKELNEYCSILIYALDYSLPSTYNFQKDIVEVIDEVWQKIVSKRDWKKNPNLGVTNEQTN